MNDFIFNLGSYNSDYAQYYKDLLINQKNQREDIEKKLSGDDRYKTPLNYFTLRGKLLEDLKEALDIFVEDKLRVATMNSYGDFGVYTKHKLFLVTENKIKMLCIVDYDGSRESNPRWNTYRDILADARSMYYTLYQYDYYTWEDCRIGRNHVGMIFGKIRNYMFNYLENHLELNSCGFDEYANSTCYFYRISAFNNDSYKEIFRKVLGDDIDLPNYTSSDKFYSFDIDLEKKLCVMRKGKNRTEMRIGKGVRKFLKCYDIEFTDEHIKRIVNRVTASASDYELRIVSGTDITKYYHNDKMYKGGSIDIGSLGCSCMRHDECGNYFKAYEDNAKMLILVHPDEDEIIGRALLWDDVTDVTNDTSIKYMDRIYGSEETYVIFKDWAEKNDYFRKEYQSYDSCKHLIKPDGSECRRTLEVNFSFTDYLPAPFCDTFMSDDGYVARNDSEWGDYSVQETDGTICGLDDNGCCDDCGEYYSECDC